MPLFHRRSGGHDSSLTICRDQPIFRLLHFYIMCFSILIFLRLLRNLQLHSLWRIEEMHMSWSTRRLNAAPIESTDYRRRVHYRSSLVRHRQCNKMFSLHLRLNNWWQRLQFPLGLERNLSSYEKSSANVTDGRRRILWSLHRSSICQSHKFTRPATCCTGRLGNKNNYSAPIGDNVSLTHAVEETFKVRLKVMPSTTCLDYDTISRVSAQSA